MYTNPYESPTTEPRRDTDLRRKNTPSLLIGVVGMVVLTSGIAWEAWNQRVGTWPTGWTWILMAIGAALILWSFFRWLQ